MLGSGLRYHSLSGERQDFPRNFVIRAFLALY